MLTWEEDVEASALRTRGWSISAIARHLGRDREAVRDYLSGKRAGVDTDPPQRVSLRVLEDSAPLEVENCGPDHDAGYGAINVDITPLQRADLAATAICGREQSEHDRVLGIPRVDRPVENPQNVAYRGPAAASNPGSSPAATPR